MTPLLTICLPTVLSRADLFAKLHAEIQRQAEGRSVEVIVACDNKEVSIGKKRQNLLEAATGDYVCFVDDDDWISTDYVDRILAALATSPDCVGFLITCTHNGKNPTKAIASLRYGRWGEDEDGYAHTRSPYQKTPVRREIALRVGFPDLRYGEDRKYSEGLVKICKTEEFIDAVLYHYRFRQEPFMAKYGIVAPRFKPQPRSRPVVKGRDYKGRPV